MEIKVNLCKEIVLKNPSEKEFEYHLKHYDLFIVLSGSMKILIGGQIVTEKIGGAYRILGINKEEELKNYNNEKDFGMVKETFFEEIILKENENILIPPGVLHKPSLKYDCPKCTFYVVKIAKE